MDLRFIIQGSLQLPTPHLQMTISSTRGDLAVYLYKCVNLMQGPQRVNFCSLHSHLHLLPMEKDALAKRLCHHAKTTAHSGSNHRYISHHKQPPTRSKQHPTKNRDTTSQDNCVLSINCPTYNISDYLSTIITLLVGKTRHFIHNTADFTNMVEYKRLAII